MAASQASSEQVSRLAEQYARALFDLAQERNQLPVVAGEIRQVADLVQNEELLRRLFEHRSIDLKRRAATIDRVFGGRVSATLQHFLQVLNRKGRLGELQQVATGFERLVKQALGQVDVDVYTARPLEASDAVQVAARLTSALKREALLRQHVDPALIGGIRIRVGDRLIDGSVSSRLRRLKKQLQENGYEQLRRSSGRLIQE